MGKSVPAKRGAKFRPITLKMDGVLVSGGYNRSREHTNVKALVFDGGQPLTFLRVHSKTPWLIKGATGRSRLGFSSSMTLLQYFKFMRQLSRTILAHGINALRCRGEADASAHESADGEARDRVREVDVYDIPTTVAGGKGALGARYWWHYSRHDGYNKIIEIVMPHRAPESGVDEGVRRVRLLFSYRRRTTWLCTGDAQWAVSYLREQVDAYEVARGVCSHIGHATKPAVQVCPLDSPEHVQHSSPPTSSSAVRVHGHTYNCDTIQPVLVQHSRY